jgi:hypothetical protein
MQCNNFCKGKFTWWWPCTAETPSDREVGQENKLLLRRKCMCTNTYGSWQQWLEILILFRWGSKQWFSTQFFNTKTEAPLEIWNNNLIYLISICIYELYLTSIKNIFIVNNLNKNNATDWRIRAYMIEILIWVLLKLYQCESTEHYVHRIILWCKTWWFPRFDSKIVISYVIRVKILLSIGSRPPWIFMRPRVRGPPQNLRTYGLNYLIW